MATDFNSEGLLEGLDGRAREARLELLEKLEAGGASLTELRDATRQGVLPLVAVDRALGGGEERYTGDEVAELSGVEGTFLDRLWRALGMVVPPPGEPAYSEADLEAARRVNGFRAAGLSDEGLLEVARVSSRAMANVAAAVGTVFSDTFLRPGGDEVEIAERYAEAASALTPTVGPVLAHVFGVQQRNQIRQAAMDGTALSADAGPGAEELSFCFADLVGFTSLGESVPADELGAVAQRLEELAIEAADPPVRLVKTIGDAVMLSSRDNDALLSTVLDLVDAVDRADDLPPLKAGIARGEALGRYGDWYGRPVNLASRVTGIARPGSVLVEGAAHLAAEGDYKWSFAGGRKVKGVDGEVKLWRVRAPEPAKPE